MSKIKSKWTTQEKIIHNYLKGIKVKHRMHPSIEGNPDVLLTGINTLIFLDGCFWHKCPKCFKIPANRRGFWKKKINNNIKRDKEITRTLRKHGYNVIRIWEHQINQKKPISKVFKNIF
jgi:DNA mismatch endonuclease (patch repair protein)